MACVPAAIIAVLLAGMTRGALADCLTPLGAFGSACGFSETTPIETVRNFMCDDGDCKTSLQPMIEACTNDAQWGSTATNMANARTQFCHTAECMAVQPTSTPSGCTMSSPPTAAELCASGCRETACRIVGACTDQETDDYFVTTGVAAGVRTCCAEPVEYTDCEAAVSGYSSHCAGDYDAGDDFTMGDRICPDGPCKSALEGWITLCADHEQFSAEIPGMEHARRMYCGSDNNPDNNPDPAVNANGAARAGCGSGGGISALLGLAGAAALAAAHGAR